LNGGGRASSGNGRHINLDVNVHLKGAHLGKEKGNSKGKRKGKSNVRTSIVADDEPSKISITDDEDKKFESVTGKTTVRVFDSEKKKWSPFKGKGKPLVRRPLPRFRELNSNDNDPTLNDEDFQNSQGPRHGNGFKFYGAPRKHFARQYRRRPQRRQLTNIVSSDHVSVKEQREHDNKNLKHLIKDAASFSAKIKTQNKAKKAEEEREQAAEEQMLSKARYPRKFLKKEARRQITKTAFAATHMDDADVVDNVDFPDDFKVEERLRKTAKKDQDKLLSNFKFPREFLAEDGEVDEDGDVKPPRRARKSKKSRSPAQDDEDLEEEFEEFAREEESKKKKALQKKKAAKAREDQMLEQVKFPKEFLKWERHQKDEEALDEYLATKQYPKEFLDEERGKKAKITAIDNLPPFKQHAQSPKKFKSSVDPPHPPRAGPKPKALPPLKVHAPGEPKRQGVALPPKKVIPYNGPARFEVNAPSEQPPAPKPKKHTGSVTAILHGSKGSVDADGGDAGNVVQEKGGVNAPNPFNVKSSVNAPFAELKQAVEAPADDTENDDVTADEEAALVAELEKDPHYLEEEGQFWADAHTAAKTLRRQADVGDMGVRDGEDVLDSNQHSNSVADLDSAATSDFVDLDPDANFDDLE